MHPVKKELIKLEAATAKRKLIWKLVVNFKCVNKKYTKLSHFF